MIKKNPEITQSHEFQLASLRGEYERRRIISTLKNNPGWLGIAAILNESLVKLKARRFDQLRLSDNELRAVLKEEGDIEGFLDLVEKSEEHMTEIERRMASVQATIDDRKRANTAPF